MVRFPARASVRTTSDAHFLPVQWVQQLFLVGSSGRGVKLSTSHTAEYKNWWSYVSISPYGPSWYAQRQHYLYSNIHLLGLVLVDFVLGRLTGLYNIIYNIYYIIFI